MPSTYAISIDPNLHVKGGYAMIAAASSDMELIIMTVPKGAMGLARIATATGS